MEFKEFKNNTFRSIIDFKTFHEILSILRDFKGFLLKSQQILGFSKGFQWILKLLWYFMENIYSISDFIFSD